MAGNQNSLKKLAFLGGALLCALSTASLAGTSAPYYFGDHAGNVQGLYTDTRCNGLPSGCVGFGRYCNMDFYSNSYARKKAKETWQYKGYIGIRQNSGNHPVVCELKK
ncbi:hypothetical protein ACK6D9_04045 [Hoeflea sp. Naph1]|uniref:hypothetical protein n=1 Tax=Hoeflea sp. Naph1 TaxID=3388653 RepID=UPI00398FBE0B